MQLVVREDLQFHIPSEGTAEAKDLGDEDSLMSFP